MEEEWKIISEYPDYEVSNLGRVRRLTPGYPQAHTFPGRIRKQRKDIWNYSTVCLYRGKNKKHVKVHRCVLISFIGPAPEGYQGNHKDGNKDHNYLENLEWVSRSENAKHAFANGLMHTRRGEKAFGSKLKAGEVFLIKRLLASKKFSQTVIKKIFKVHQMTISDINTGKCWTHIPYP